MSNYSIFYISYKKIQHQHIRYNVTQIINISHKAMASYTTNINEEKIKAVKLSLAVNML